MPTAMRSRSSTSHCLATAPSLFAAALDATVARGQIRDIVLEGFFPCCPSDAVPLGRKGGLREIGLPYAVDSAISRHLAAFLSGRHVDAVLLAGGTLRPRAIQERLLAVIEAWQGRRPAHLALGDMSLAIAQGAARFAALPEGAHERIRGGYPHGVYLELERAAPDAAPRLVCVLPKGVEEGSAIELAEPAFDLLVNRPVRFTAYTSNRRPDDAAGTLVPLDPNVFHPLPTLQTTLMLDDERFNPRTAAKQSIGVRVEARLTELGALQLALVNPESGRSWELAFNLRQPVDGSDPAAEPGKRDSPGVRPEAIEAAGAHCALFFGGKQSLDASHKAKSLVRDLERILGQERHRWNVPLLRALWPAIHPGITRRGRSLAHENAWLYLAGFVLRPGYGTDLDHWRVMQLWECFGLGLVHKKEKSAQSNWWMMWRRTAGGIPAAEQERLFAAALPHLKRSAAEFVEGTRLLGSLERVEQSHKVELATWLLDLVRRGRAANQSHVFWALARVLGRVPLYTSAETVVPASVVEDSFARVEALDWSEPGLRPLAAVFAAACRRTNERLLDIDDALRPRVAEKLGQAGAKDEQIRCVLEYREVSAADRNDLFGEQLPAGLRLVTV